MARGRLGVLLGLLLGLLGGSACAQTLDLGPPKALRFENEPARVSAWREHANTLKKDSHTAVIHRIAADWLEHAVKRGDQGALHWVAAHRLAGAVEGEPTARCSNVDQLAGTPEDPAELDRVLLRAFMDSNEPAGWPYVPQIPPISPGRWPNIDRAIDAADMSVALKEAAHRLSQDVARTRLRDVTARQRASQIMWMYTLLRPGSPLNEQARAQLRERVSVVLASMEHDGPPAEFAAWIDEYEHVAIIALLMEEAWARPHATRLKPLVEMIESGANVGTPNAARRLAALRRGLEVAGELSSLDDESAVMRPARLIFRLMVSAAKQSQVSLLRALPDVATKDGMLTDPAYLSMLSGHEKRLDELRLVHRATGLLSSRAEVKREPELNPEYKDVGLRLLALGQEASQARTRDAAMAEVREILTEVDTLLELPGEADLRTTAIKGVAGIGLPWNELTGGRASELVRMIDAARLEWAAGRGKKGARPEGAIATLRCARRICIAVRDAATAQSLVGKPGQRPPMGTVLERWPAWYMSSKTLAGLVGPMPAEATRAINAAMADPTRGEAILTAFRETNAAGLVPVRIAQRLTEFGIRPNGFTRRTDLAAGPMPTWAWLAPKREVIARFCRLAEARAALAAQPDGQVKAEHLHEEMRRIARTLHEISG